MKTLILIDKFKKTLTSKKLGQTIKHYLTKNNILSDYLPISDGGDGFLDSINYQHHLTNRYCIAKDAYGTRKKVRYLMDHSKVYIEIAKIVGGNYPSLNIFKASSFGVGQVILDAIKKGGRIFYIGLGGSMCNDCGKGMLEALGLYQNNQLTNLYNIDFSLYQFYIVSDVNNPLLGPNGATYTFAAQKGAKDNDLKILEQENYQFSNYIYSKLHKNYALAPGAGAAGGIGFALLSVLKATYLPGIQFIMNYLNILTISKNYDLIITGEGKIDEQSFHGKVIFEILNTLKKKTIIFCAINDLKTNVNFNPLILKIYSIVPTICNATLSLKHPQKCFQKLLKESKFIDFYLQTFPSSL